MTLLIILLDYKFQENVTDALGTGGQTIRRTFFLITMFIALEATKRPANFNCCKRST